MAGIAALLCLLAPCLASSSFVPSCRTPWTIHHRLEGGGKCPAVSRLRAAAAAKIRMSSDGGSAPWAEIREIMDTLHEETIRRYTKGTHHCAFKVDTYTKPPGCPHK